MKLRAALLLMLIAVPVAAHACPVCYGSSQTPLTKSANDGILFLLGVVGVVQTGFVLLFFSFRRRARELEKKSSALRAVGRLEQ